jgi:aminoglycoside 6'-N-acetyltransferase I
MLVREIEDQDYDEWLRMRQALWPQHSVSEHKEEMDEILQNPNISVFTFARADGTMGGFLEAATRAYAEGCHSSPVGYIEGWYVDEDLRQKGWGARLIRAAENWALSRGCIEMASDCELDNLTSHLAHSALGYEETDRLIHFRKKL